MRTQSLYRLASIVCAGILVVFSSVAFSASYKCEKDGAVVYSDTRCGPAVRQSGEVQNSYSGGLRVGEQQMLNEAASREHSTAPAANSSSTSYGERIKAQNEKRKSEGDKRRIHSDATSPWR